MNSRIDSFIKEHKKYFEKNKELIESNTWHHNITQDPEENSHVKPILRSIENKNDSLKIDKEVVERLLKRLKSFVDVAESDMRLKKCKNFLNSGLNIVDLFFDKCDEYLEKTDATKIQDLDVKQREIKFQNDVFYNKAFFKDYIIDKEIQSEKDIEGVKFYNDAKSSLVLKEPLIYREDEIKQKHKEGYFPSGNPATSKEMFINMKESDIPSWNPKKHFFEQDKDVLQFWTEEYNKIKNGINIGGYFIHPWLYFHTNHFKTPIPAEDGTEPPTTPFLRDNEWFLAECLKEAESETPGYYDKILMFYGSRRISKSTIMSSMAHYKGISRYNSLIRILSGSTKDLDELTSKFTFSLDHCDPFIKIQLLRNKLSNGISPLGIKKTQQNNVEYSRVEVINLEDGSTRSKEKAAGGGPSVFLVDEIAKFDFIEMLLGALPSFKTPYGMKTLTVLSGTSGTADLSKDAMKVVVNPEAYNILPMNFDKLESKIDDEDITWKRRNFCSFFPGQMSYDKGLKKNKTKLSDFLQLKSKKLDELSILATDWKKNREFLDTEIERLKKQTRSSNSIEVIKQRLYFPQDPQDCLMTSESNPFRANEAKKVKEELQVESGKEEGFAKKVYLDYSTDKNRVIEIAAPDAPIPEFPHPGGFIDSPVLLYEDLPTEKPEKFVYIAGLDDYKQEDSKSSSLGSFTIFKRDVMSDNGLTIAAKYKARPDPHSYFHRQGRFLLMAFNAMCFMENEDMGFKDFLENKRETVKFLQTSVDFTSDMQVTYGGKRKFGWDPNKYKPLLIQKLIEYTEKEFEITNEDNEKVTVTGMRRIPDIGILDEIINFKKDGNYDDLTSFGSCLLYDFYLNKVYGRPEQHRKDYFKDNRKEIKTRSDWFDITDTDSFF